MYYVAPDGRFYDDGRGTETAPAYGVSADGSRHELDEGYAFALTERFARDAASAFPIGDYVARVTKAFGFEPCTPCEERRRALNRLGDRAASLWRTPR